MKSRCVWTLYTRASKKASSTHGAFFNKGGDVVILASFSSILSERDTNEMTFLCTYLFTHAIGQIIQIEHRNTKEGYKLYKLTQDINDIKHLIKVLLGRYPMGLQNYAYIQVTYT